MNVRPNITLIERVAAELRDYMGDDFDEQAFIDSLDGETDFADIADAVLERMQEDEAIVAGLSQVIKQMEARRNRIASHEGAYKRTLLKLLDAAGIKKLDRPRALVSKRQGSVSVRITDESDIPSQLMREKVTRAPDKAEIKKHLEAGERVPGAELARGDDTVMVKVS